MNISDILHRLANNIDGHNDGARPDPELQNPAQLNAIPTGQNVVDVDNAPTPNGTTASGNDTAPDLFLPPLQMKSELLKKSVGVENVYDDGVPTEKDAIGGVDGESQDQAINDIINRLKNLSGIPLAAVQELGSDEVFDD
jgi:hypothetical protein